MNKLATCLIVGGIAIAKLLPLAVDGYLTGHPDDKECFRGVGICEDDITAMPPEKDEKFGLARKLERAQGKFRRGRGKEHVHQRRI
jgi:hypothetical protein